MSIKTTNARMQQLTGKWSDLNTDNLLVGEMAVPSDHNPVIKTGDNKIREIPLLEDMSEYETYIAQLRSAIDEANRLIDEVITKVGINDNEIGTTTTYSSSKIEERIGTIEPTAIINDTTASNNTVYSSNKVESKITETKNEIGESITTINNNITQITEDVSTLNSNMKNLITVRAYSLGTISFTSANQIKDIEFDMSKAEKPICVIDFIFSASTVGSQYINIVRYSKANMFRVMSSVAQSIQVNALVLCYK